MALLMPCDENSIFLLISKQEIYLTLTTYHTSIYYGIHLSIRVKTNAFTVPYWTESASASPKRARPIAFSVSPRTARSWGSTGVTLYQITTRGLKFDTNNWSSHFVSWRLFPGMCGHKCSRNWLKMWVVADIIYIWCDKYSWRRGIWRILGIWWCPSMI